MADLTAIGCQVETTARAAGKVRWLGRDLVIRPDAILSPSWRMWVRAGEGQKTASGAMLARRPRQKRKVAGGVNLV